MIESEIDSQFLVNETAKDKSKKTSYVCQSPLLSSPLLSSTLL